MIKKETIFGAKKDIIFMQEALAQAQLAYEQNEVPIGAIVVGENGIVIARAHNLVETNKTQTAHAEHLALQQAGKVLDNWRLEGCWLYVTLEPCAMCMHLIRLSRLAGVIFAAPSPLFGFRLDSEHSFRVYKKNAFSIVEGVGLNEAKKVLKQFFKEKRGEASDFVKTQPRGSKKGTT